jgi:hypothetical protein
MFRDFKISYPYPILYPFSAFSARDFGFQRQDFSFSTAVSAISAVICNFLAALLIDQGYDHVQAYLGICQKKLYVKKLYVKT